MRSFFALLATVSFAVQVYAQVGARACNCPATRVVSGGKVIQPTPFPQASVHLAIGMGVAANPTPTATSGVIYPHRFSNNEGITFPNCPGAQTLVEYPLRLPTEVGAARHRVVYDYNKPHRFCGCMTHDGAIGNQFVACNWQHWLSDPLVEQDGSTVHPPQISEMDLVHDPNE